MDVALTPDGDAELDLRVGGGRVSSDADLGAFGLRIARALFPGARGIRVVIEDRPGSLLARAHVPRVYRPGRRVSLRLDTAGIWRETAARHVPRTRVRIWVPAVPVTVRGEPGPERSHDGTWLLRPPPPGRASRVDIVMRPRPLRWHGVMALFPLAAVAAFAAFAARRPATALAAGGLAGVAVVLTVTAGAGRQGDNLGVAGVSGLNGVLEGTPLAVVSAAPLATAFLGLLGAAAAIVRAVRAAVVCRPAPRVRPPERGHPRPAEPGPRS